MPVKHDNHVGNHIAKTTNSFNRNILTFISTFYQRSNHVLKDFCVCESETIDSLQQNVVHVLVYLLVQLGVLGSAAK